MGNLEMLLDNVFATGTGGPWARRRMARNWWRMLAKQFNARTLSSTLHAQDLETRPKGAAKMADLPQCMLEWERNLRRCIQEERSPPSDEAKRLARLRMIPPKGRWT